MDDSTPQDHLDYVGDADGGAGGAANFLEDEEGGAPRGYEGLNLREVDLRELARKVIVEAASDVAIWGPIDGSPRRQRHALDDSMPSEEAVPVRLSHGGSGWLEITDKGARIFDEPLRSDRVILAALCAAATTAVDHTGRGNTERRWRAARVYVLLDSKGLMEPFDLDRIAEVAGSDPQLGSIKGPELFDAWKLRLHDALVRYYRPDYAELPDEERVAVLVKAAEQVDVVVAAVQALQNFLESAVTNLSKQRPRGDRYKGADPQRDVLAAELRGALKLTHRKIAEFLEFPLPDDFKDTGNNPAVRSAIDRGQKVLEQALPSEGEYERYMKRIKPGLKDWYEYVSALNARARTHIQK